MQADVKTYLIFDFHRLKNIVHGIAIASSLVKDLIRNKSETETESKMLITIGNISLSLCYRYWDRVSVAKDCQTILIGHYPKAKIFEFKYYIS